MLTLIQGSSKKSVYMWKLYRGTDNSLFIQYGEDSNLKFADTSAFILSRSDLGKTHPSVLSKELWSMISEIMSTMDYRNVFIYGAFSTDDIETFREIHDKIDGRLDIIVSIHDESIRNGITIREFN